MGNNKFDMSLPSGKPIVFRGVATAIITPFSGREVDFGAMREMTERQIKAGVSAIVVCGTTGEAPTLKHDEHIGCVRRMVEIVDGRIPVIAGTGSNDTDHAVTQSKMAEDVGADALLLVTPYYNRATPTGLIRNFTAIADAVSIPTILYNVPGRTCVDIPMNVYRALSDHENIVGVKEASGRLSAAVDIINELGDKYLIYTGCDQLIAETLAVGGEGVISVISNVAPAETRLICDRHFSGDESGAATIQKHLAGLIDAMFCEVNPIPVKAACAMMGLCRPDIRLPLCEPTPENEARIRSELQRYGFL